MMLFRIPPVLREYNLMTRLDNTPELSPVRL